MDHDDKLLALAASVETLAGSCRLHDGRIEFALHGKGGRLYPCVRLMGLVARNDCPAYTRSLDDAMTLVPEGVEWSLDSTGFYAVVNDKTSGGKTPALALTAAALRARAAVSPTPSKESQS